MTKAREDSGSIVREFVECINAGDGEDLMMHEAEDFIFIDYDGDITRGRDDWYSYLEKNPKYRIHIDHIANSGKGVAIIGRTTGCHVGPEVEKAWKILWIAQVQENLIAEWRIYSDVHEIREAANIGERTKEHMEKLEKAKSVTLRFVDAINAGDSDGLMALQTEDFTLIDYRGDAHQGRDGWHDYFAENPEYKIHVKHVITSGSSVAILGRTTGSHVAPEVEDKETILWTAKIRDNLVAEWRLYSDTEKIESEIRSQ